MTHTKICFYILVCIIITSNQTIGQTSYGKTLLDYEFQIMNCRNHDLKNILLLEKGLWQKSIKNYESAIKTFSRINDDILNDSLKHVMLYNKAFCYYLLYDLFNSKNTITKLSYLKPQYYTNETWILELLINSKLNNSQEFNNCFLELARINHYSDTLFTNTHKYHINKPIKSTKLGKSIAAFDMLQNGFKTEGLMSISLISLSMVNCVFQAYFGMYSIGVFTGIYPFLKFKMGSKILLTDLIHERNLYNSLQNELYMNYELKKISANIKELNNY